MRMRRAFVSAIAVLALAGCASSDSPADGETTLPAELAPTPGNVLDQAEDVADQLNSREDDLEAQLEDMGIGF